MIHRFAIDITVVGNGSERGADFDMNRTYGL